MTSGARERGERGAVAVVVALLMVPLIGFAAISVDVAAMWSERQELQNGADAGALAVAQDCARSGCGDAAGTAQTLAEVNVTDGGVTAGVAGAGADQVRVTTSGVRRHIFAPVLGFDSSTIVAHAGAGWGTPSAGTAELPLAVSWCDFQVQTGGRAPTGDLNRTISLTADAVEDAGAPTSSPSADAATQAVVPAPAETSCAGPSGAPVAGGFALLDPDAGTCAATSSLTGGARSAGDTLPGSCSTAFQRALNRPVVLPVFEGRTGTDANAGYRVYGYAAFTLTGYHFAGELDGGASCTGPASCISGYFTRFVDLSDRFSYRDGAPQLGAAVVSLTQ